MDATDAPRYDAIVFDNDGVLVELTDRAILAEAIHETFAEFDVSVPASVARERANQDLPPDEAFEATHGIDHERFWARREALVSRRQREAIQAGEKGLHDDVAVVEQLDHSLAIVSNNQHETVEFIVDHYELGHHFEVVYGREPTVAGARRKKPDPSYIEQALTDLGTRDALYVGDSEKDVIAAERAGIDVAFLDRPHHSTEPLSTAPTYEVSDLWALAEAIGCDGR